MSTYRTAGPRSFRAFYKRLLQRRMTGCWNKWELQKVLSAELGAMNGEEEMDETAELRHELKYGITFPTIQTDSAVFMG